MPELIERGYVYIAQPPLYRIKKGSAKERYLKNEQALEDYLTETGIDGVTVALHDGKVLQGEALGAFAEKSRGMKAAIKALARKVGHQAIVEQAAIAGALTPDAARATAAAQTLVQRLDAISLPAERGWKVAPVAGGLTLARTVRGVAERHVVEAATLRSAEARWLAERASALTARFATPAMLRIDTQEGPVAGPASAFERLLAAGRKGLSINRFKGLGEMNPEQLWHTTLDPATRTLLQVKVGDAEDAGQVFATLMGDVVEPRREFIVDNALKVANLDV
jgi:DNA gyrase subunit B